MKSYTKLEALQFHGNFRSSEILLQNGIGLFSCGTKIPSALDNRTCNTTLIKYNSSARKYPSEQWLLHVRPGLAFKNPALC